MWKSLFGGDEEEQEGGILDDESDGMCSLSPMQRVYAFAACLLIGLILMFLVSESLELAFLLCSLNSVLGYGEVYLPNDHYNRIESLIVFTKPIKFALLFTFGNLMAVGSTAFLIGAAQQMRMMFDSTRLYATAIYLGCVVLALICALLVQLELYPFCSEDGVKLDDSVVRHRALEADYAVLAILLSLGLAFFVTAAALKD